MSIIEILKLIILLPLGLLGLLLQAVISAGTLLIGFCLGVYFFERAMDWLSPSLKQIRNLQSDSLLTYRVLKILTGLSLIFIICFYLKDKNL